MIEFDDSRLDDPDALQAADPWLRYIASAGARIRVEVHAAESALSRIDAERPRAVIAVGQEARLIRAVLEPTCPVPFVAWPTHSLPGWVGPLDLVLALASTGADREMLATVYEASRRGSRLVVVAPEFSAIAEHAAGNDTTLIPSTTSDAQSAALAMLVVLARMGLGPEVVPESVATELDAVAEECSPVINLAKNPAKDLALGLADTLPLVWGGSVLAARASRRVAEGIRLATGRPVLAGELDDLLPIIRGSEPRDPFADPDLEQDRRPALVVLDDSSEDVLVDQALGELRAAAEATGVRVCTIAARSGGIVERYARLYAHGLYGAGYLAVGLGLSPSHDD